MNYNISSSKLQHPLIKPILEKLSNYFEGMDMAKIIGDSHATKKKIIEIIKKEIDKEEQSKLINQIIETNKSFSYEEVVDALKNIIEGLNLKK